MYRKFNVSMEMYEVGNSGSLSKNKCVWVIILWPIFRGWKRLHQLLPDKQNNGGKGLHEMCWFTPHEMNHSPNIHVESTGSFTYISLNKILTYSSDGVQSKM
jgi:hypothetical protein